MSDKPSEPAPKTVDWNQVMVRLQATRQAIRKGTQLTPEQRRAILHKRALELARTEAVATTTETPLSVVEFMLGDSAFAIDANAVSEVFDYREIVPVPCTPPHVIGLINARGQIVSVTDIKILLGLPHVESTVASKILMLSGPQVEFGLLVDALHHIHDVMLESLARRPADPIQSEFLLGTTPDGIYIIDAPRLLADPRMVVGE